jgi:acetyl esterase/lipase
MQLNRRDALLLGAAAGASALAPSAAWAYGPNHEDALRPESLYQGAPRPFIPLWPRNPPGAPRRAPAEEITERSQPPALRDRMIGHVARPMMAVFQPETPNGAAMIIAPGGGYSRVVADKEGYEIAEWFAARGFTCFVLFYRLPGDNWGAGPDVSLQDAQRAMRIVRARAGEFAIDPERIAFMGCSAGGHVAGSLSLRFDAEVYARVDSADDVSARPDASALIYPVTMMIGDWVHEGSRRQLLGEAPSEELMRAYSLDLHARADAPPTIFIHAADDEAVPVINTLSLLHALHQLGVATELHVFEAGGHGFGTRLTIGKPTEIWPQLVYNWLGARGLFAPA